MKIDNIGTSTVIWKKDNRIITAGSIVIRKDKRFSLDRFNLSLKGVALRDAGEYVCEVETYSSKPIRQISHLQVLVPPQVQPHPQVGDFKVLPHRHPHISSLITGIPSFSNLIRPFQV